MSSESPEAAVSRGFPSDVCRILATETRDDRSIVFVEIVEGSYKEERIFLCTRTGDGWSVAIDGGTHWWTALNEDEDTGIGVLGSRLSHPGSGEVAIHFGKATQTFPVKDGIVLAVVWSVNDEEWVDATIVPLEQ